MRSAKQVLELTQKIAQDSTQEKIAIIESAIQIEIDNRSGVTEIQFPYGTDTSAVRQELKKSGFKILHHEDEGQGRSWDTISWKDD